jgi:hypothetical protein
MYRIYIYDDYGKKQNDVISFREARDYFFHTVKKSPYYSVSVVHFPSNLYVLSFSGLTDEEDVTPQFFVDVDFEGTRIFKSFNRALSFFKSEVENNKFKYVYLAYGDYMKSYTLARYDGSSLVEILRKYGRL